MGSIDRYIFRTTLASFALVLVSLTGVIWITQALRGIDLMTSQGQTIITFLGVTSLVIPALVLIISPIALMIAISHTLNKLATDSEIIVMNAAGFSPFRLFRPFFHATVVVAVMVAFIAACLAPDGMRRLKNWDAEITADVLTDILQPGRFAQLDQNLTIRIRERQPGGVLAGIFVDDRRDPKERVSIIADHGTVLKNDNGSFLILEDGNLERFETGKRDPALVAFGRYALDMFGLRMAGFACSVMAVKSPLAPVIQYLMLAIAVGAIIVGGVVIEPPAPLIEAINKSNARLLRLFGRPATA